MIMIVIHVLIMTKGTSCHVITCRQIHAWGSVMEVKGKFEGKCHAFKFATCICSVVVDSSLGAPDHRIKIALFSHY